MAISTKKILGMVLLVGGAIYYFKSQASAQKTSGESSTDDIEPAATTKPAVTTKPLVIASQPTSATTTSGTTFSKGDPVTYGGQKYTIDQVLTATLVMLRNASGQTLTAHILEIKKA